MAKRTVRVVTSDESLIASARSAVGCLPEWDFVQLSSDEGLASSPPVAGDVILLDAWLQGVNVYEVCRRLTGRTKCRTFLVVDAGNDLAEPIARFCGATGVLPRPVAPSTLRIALDVTAAPPSLLPHDDRERQSFDLPEALLVDITTGKRDERLIDALIDPETGLFNYSFLNYKLDEEFKRAKRFDQPLACVMLGFEGQADEEVLRELAAIFLESSRDTDTLGRFDESSFLFLLPNTGPDGATVMAYRVAEHAEQRELADLVGDPVEFSVGISSYPHPAIQKREHLFGRARDAFMDARREGGGVVRAT